MAKEQQPLAWTPKRSGPRPSVSSAQRERYPTLSAVLEGQTNDAGVEARPAYAITLFVGSDGVRFSFGSRESEETWFGSAGKLADILQSIEAAIACGDYEAKFVKKGRGGGFG